ncbi:hypothetical protein P7L78_26840 [Tistrella bauzanensis]|uniref:Short-chain dehydrogenase n=1 Tax=Tistrella arctica TaxID=3133430 RepID=A0ABU9YGY6_9PROT
MDIRFHTALMIGATGMLRAALDAVATRSERVLAVSRHAGLSLRHRPVSPGDGMAPIVPLDLDWQQPDSFMTGIEAAIEGARLDLVVIWMHGSGQEALRRLLRQLAGRPDCLVVHVLSSAAGDAAAFRAALSREAGGPVLCRYRTVKLGAIMNGLSFDRWLTHEEISRGVIRAILTAEDVVVGSVPAGR